MKTRVQVLVSHTISYPATTLTSVTSTGERSHIANIPARTDTYTEGQVCEFRSKRDAKAFVAAHPAGTTAILP